MAARRAQADHALSLTSATRGTRRLPRVGQRPGSGVGLRLLTAVAGGPRAVLRTLAVQNYRSLWRLVVPLTDLNVVTGPNGSGKSSLYRALRLLADASRNGAVAAFAREGGLLATLWAGPEKIGRAVREGRYPVQGAVRTDPAALRLGFGSDDFGYAQGGTGGVPPGEGRTGQVFSLGACWPGPTGPNLSPPTEPPWPPSFRAWSRAVPAGKLHRLPCEHLRWPRRHRDRLAGPRRCARRCPDCGMARISLAGHAPQQQVSRRGDDAPGRDRGRGHRQPPLLPAARLPHAIYRAGRLHARHRISAWPPHRRHQTTGQGMVRPPARLRIIRRELAVIASSNLVAPIAGTLTKPALPGSGSRDERPRRSRSRRARVTRRYDPRVSAGMTAGLTTRSDAKQPVLPHLSPSPAGKSRSQRHYGRS